MKLYKDQLVRCIKSSGGGSFTAGFLYAVKKDFDGFGYVDIWRNNSGIPDAFGVMNFVPALKPENDPVVFKNETITLGVRPSIADDLNLYPNDRKVLAHLSAGNTLTKLEAQSVYGNWSVAGSIFRLRAAGYKVKTKLCHDATGHRYARYSLAV